MFKKKLKKPKEPYKFIFPNFAAKIMKDVPLRAQLEGSLLSMFLIMISLTLMAIYFLFFGEQGWVYKTLLLINLGCGFLFLSSFLITTYQQYITHMSAMGFNPQKEREDVLKRGNLFKRIKLALKERKKVKMKEKKSKAPLLPNFVSESLESMKEIDNDKDKEMERLKRVAQGLQERSLEDTNRNEKEVNEKYGKK